MSEKIVRWIILAVVLGLITAPLAWIFQVLWGFAHIYDGE